MPSVWRSQIEAHEIHRGKGLEVCLSLALTTIQVTVRISSAKFPEGTIDATRGLLATERVILNHGQVTWTTPELAPPLLTTTPHQREDVSALDRFYVHRCPTRRVFSGTGIELVTRQATIRYLYHSATAATSPARSHGVSTNGNRPVNPG
ncbi:uncharacterized protein TNCV_3741671 [Trichonephila clavipes]|nr:uncharacterized protein TNCV_3741671 [Trichonephila clavipes]